MSTPTASVLTPEQRLLYAVAREDLTADRLAALITDDLQWGPLVWLAEMCRATPVLWGHLKRLDPSLLPPEAEALQHASMVSEFRMRHLERRLDQCIGLLEGAGIPVMLLKGAGLAKTVYDSFVERPMSDLDILVPSAQAQRAWETLREAGWHPAEDDDLEEVYQEQHHHLPPIYDPDGTETAVEIHRRLFPGTHPFGLDAEDFWQAAQPLPGRESVLIPAPHHQIVHLAIHFAWSHMMGQFAAWRTFRDIGRLMRAHAMDWDSVVEDSRAARATTSTYWTLRLGRGLVGLDVPDRTLLALAPPLKAIHGVLERSYALGMLPWGRKSNPSVSLARRLWSLGVRPRWSGHDGVKPWEVSEPFTGPARSSWERMAHQVRQIPAWGTYLRALLLPGSSA